MTRIPWKCPNCGDGMTAYLAEKPYVLRCALGHRFDISKQGYVNLLLPQKRGSTPPGDDANMVRARTAFLDGGYYKAFSDGVNRLVADALRENASAPCVIADAGCGEGYYTHNLVSYLREGGTDAVCAGFDLSKDAVSHGAKRAKASGNAESLSFAVASLFEMPLADGSCDGIINLFAPTADDEFARILKPDGFLVLAVPAERHLWGLKCAVYDTPYENEVRRDVLPHFTLKEVRQIRETVTVCGNDHIKALFAMTPYFWKTSVSDRQKLDTLEQLTTEIAFDLLLYGKN